MIAPGTQIALYGEGACFGRVERGVFLDLTERGVIVRLRGADFTCSTKGGFGIHADGSAWVIASADLSKILLPSNWEAPKWWP